MAACSSADAVGDRRRAGRDGAAWATSGSRCRRSAPASSTRSAAATPISRSAASPPACGCRRRIVALAGSIGAAAMAQRRVQRAPGLRTGVPDHCARSSSDVEALDRLLSRRPARRPARPGRHRPRGGRTLARRRTASRRWVRADARRSTTRGQHLYLIGNGGSAAMASHLAADACKNGRLRAMAFNDAALLTATANDVAFEEVFALPLDRLGRAGDLLIAISSSGQLAEHRAGAGDRRGRCDRRSSRCPACAPTTARATLGDLNFYVPSRATAGSSAPISSILHYWLDQYSEPASPTARSDRAASSITGGCGYVGTKLTAGAARAHGHDVTVLDAHVVRQPPRRRIRG